MSRFLSLLVLLGAAVSNNIGLGCRVLDGHRGGHVTKLQNSANYDKETKYRYIQSAALEAKSYLLLKKKNGELKYHLTQYNLDDSISHRLFDWKRRIFYYSAKNADLPYKVKCYKKDNQGFFLVKAKRSLLHFDYAVSEMSIGQFTRYLVHAAETIAEYQSMGAAFVELLDNSFFSEAEEITQPVLTNFIALAKINQYCYVSRSLAATKNLFSEFVNVDKEKNLLPTAYGKPRELINTHTLIQFLKHAANMYVLHHRSGNAEAVRNVVDFEDKISQLENLDENVTIKDVLNQIEIMMFFATKGDEPLLKRSGSSHSDTSN